MRQYFGRKLLIYILTFLAAVTIDWLIPRFMPGDPIQAMLSRASLRAEAAKAMYTYYTQAFGLDLPIWQQYLNFWNALFHGDLGTSVWLFPQPVLKIIMNAVPYDILLLLPSILLSYWAGNHFGAFAARSKRLDNTICPSGISSRRRPTRGSASCWPGCSGLVLPIFPIAGAYSFAMASTKLSWPFVKSLFEHWCLPFASLFIVQFGGWAIGMRNMIIYELEADYSHYLEALGAPRKLVRKYAYNNAVLPQLSGLALSLGAIVAGALATEIVFSYPGIGYLILQAIQNHDYFLLQGCFLFIIIGVLLANFIDRHRVCPRGSANTDRDAGRG